MNNQSQSSHEIRKAEHLAICVSAPVESDLVKTGLERYRFIHEALPEIDLDQVNTNSGLFGHTLDSPFVISSMTGGTPEGEKINRVLAEAAEQVKVAMGLGSQRVAIINQGLARTFQVRDVAPTAFLFANLGAIQLNDGFAVDECRKAVDMIQADALVLHLNPLQEAIQPGGNTNFSGLASKLEEICSHLPVPVVVKEVGQGISERTARLLRNAGVAGIDTAGAGGTSWALVESLRRQDMKSAVGATFTNWGIPTAESILQAHSAAPDVTLIASGGIRSGIDAAKALALGADLAGCGLPLLREATRGTAAVVNLLEQFREELRIAMFCIGARTLDELKCTTALVKSDSKTG